MLLGDEGSGPDSDSITHPRENPSARHLPDSEKHSSSSPDPMAVEFGTTLDVLHATSAALIDGTRDILLESDFENAMKVLTSWVPIQDEDVFMRVARAEWNVHRKKAR